MHFAQIYTPGIAQCSYVIGSGKKCIVIDPVRNIEQYLVMAKEFNMEIAGIIETHLHADFVSGHMELADITGAPIYAPSIANCTFPHHSIVDNEEFTIENLRFKLLETPGHTPDCAVYVVTDLERSEEPIMVFTGDTLMVGDVGRPDLFPEHEEELAEKLFFSLKRLKELPDHLEIYPAHGMGSLCGRALSAKLWSTIGTERRYNYALQHTELSSFKTDLLTDMPSAPDHFARCSEINRVGPGLKRKMPNTLPLNPKEVQETLSRGAIILDVRPYHSFAAAHIPNAYSVSRFGNLGTFAGWVVPPEKDIILVLDNEADMLRVKETLYNVGLDNIKAYLEGSIESWLNEGLPVNIVETISVQKLREWMDKEEVVVLDNRDENAWKKGHIKGTTLAPAPDLRHRYTEWDPNKTTVVLCNTSNRSMTGASILKQNNFERVINVLGGTTAWSAAGYSLETGGNK